MTDQNRPQVRIIDACFAGASSSIAGDNALLPPKNFDWYRGDEQVSEHTWYTSWTLLDALKDPSPKKVAWLIEPPSIHDWPYEFVRDKGWIFEAILTYDRDLIELDGIPSRLIPHGGSWIGETDWVMRPKNPKVVCMIVSEKDVAPGHRMRHEIAERYKNRINVCGRGYRPFNRKVDILAYSHFSYAVIVESTRMDWYFTEKLIDCFATGTIPIYRGCPSIDEFFNPRGFAKFRNVEGLEMILDMIAVGAPIANNEAMVENFKTAKEYFRPEDWAYERYPELFT